MTVERQPTNIRELRPSRKALHPGDVFALQLPDKTYLFGRVISADAQWTVDGSAPPAILYYIYRFRSGRLEIPDEVEMTSTNLLLPPGFINRLPWSRGYFQTLGNVPLKPGDALPRHNFYRSVDRNYYDDHGARVADPTEPVGLFGLQSFRVVDDLVSKALGIPLAPK